ncbi:23S rRNA accumulation protein YceD [Aeromonas rivipollensis]|uniref:23S rRNA accumulation protein YceD n=1 Tax=Aeromonas rivipollensis TaxID=948519 RepID=UPI000ED71E30|nr:23S rRNA accumulation protein YceD [Aeromonas rivipollensis]MDM5057820.1 23S rRNA accumulation protein YceD [Aeromonas rivipollensis]HCH55436.1 23S rRNA accumulation protein YceD [Aeromonas sp.]
MQKVKLPVKVDPVRNALKLLDYVGIVEKSQMPRLEASTEGLRSDVDVTLQFGKDVQKLTVMKGTAHAKVDLVCQRCGEAFEHLCEASFIYTPLFERTNEEELPEAYEPIELDENGEIDLHQILEDELILSLPQVAMHPIDVCPRGNMEMTWGDIEPADERPNPFAVLEELKRK